MPALIDPDPELPEAFTLAEALAAGLTVDQIRFRLETHRWETVGRGAYRRVDWSAAEDDPFELERRDHVHRAIAAGQRNRGAIIGYESAAMVHRLPLWRSAPSIVTLLVSSDRWSGRRRELVLRQLDVPADDVLAHDVPITTPARTWVDIARTLPLADAIVAGDAGLRGGVFDLASLRGALDRARSARGHHRARSALAYLDGSRESPGESASWAYFVVHRLLLPSCQVELRQRDGGLIGRVDFYWRWARLVGEFDGRGKYEAATDLYAEKRREDALRAIGCMVVRWGAADLKSAHLAARLRALTATAA